MPASTNPPMLVFAIRPERYSYQLLKQTKQFVVNIPGRELARQVLYCGRRSGKDVDKFKDTGLTARAAKKVKAPVIKECIAHIECELSDTIPEGDHVLVIGRVVAAYVLKDAFRGIYDLTQFQPLLYLGRDVFTTTLTETFEPKLQKASGLTRP
jgi:flavin reductase (DIM6/NTAB) family NADH-FMN oxidoreductase RutF